MSRDIEAAAAVREQLNAWCDYEWHAGSAEPWIAHLLCALILANDPHSVIEIGGFEGYTSKRLALALKTLPHKTKLTVCEIDAERAKLVDAAIGSVLGDSTTVAARVILDDSLRWIPTLPDRSVDFVWLDGNHEAAHVAEEIRLLLPKLAPGALLCGHDVFGVCDLQRVFKAYSGFSLDLPRLGPAGGIGILQIPR